MVRFLGLLALLSLLQINALDNGVGRTPAMGYSSWMDTSSAVSEARIKEITLGLIRTGLAGKGYVYVNVDEGWLVGRDKTTGKIISNSTSFPSGMKGLGDWIHSQKIPQTGKYMKYGLYTCRGTCQCSTSEYQGPGSHGFEKEDAQYMADAGADYLKEDSCCGSQDHETAFSDYGKMRDALNATGRVIYFSLCGWNDWYAPVGYSLGNSWRIAGDGDNWPALVNCINTAARLGQYAKPGGWNDPDLLISDGTGSYGPDRGGWYQTDLQSRSQFSMWCILAAPLLISANINAVTQYALDTWGNEEAIAVNQDPLGIQGIRVFGSDLGGSSGVNIFARPLADGSVAVVFLNNDPQNQDITCDEICFAKMQFGGIKSMNRYRAQIERGPAVMQACQKGDPNQQWSVNPDGTIKHVATNLCLNRWNCAKDDDADVVIATCGGSNCANLDQTWNFTASKITSRLDGKCLDQYEFTTNRVDVFSCNGGQNQAWTLNQGTLVATQSGQCLTAYPPAGNHTVTVRDLWAHKNLPDATTQKFTAVSVPGKGGCMMFKFALKAE